MLPFPRMMVYGNTKPALKAIKIRSTNNSWLVLTNNGELYARGVGAFPDGQSVSAFRSDWILIATNVKNFWGNYNHQVLYIQYTDNSIQWIGANRYRTAGSDSTYTTTLATEPIITGTVMKQFLFNDTYASILALSEDGRSFLIGSTRAYTGTVSTLSSFVMQNSGLVDIFCTGTNFFATSTNGTVYGGGQNIANILNTSASSGTFYSFPVSIGQALSADSTLGYVSTSQYAIKFRNTSNALVGRGYGFNGFFGNNSTNDLASTTNIIQYYTDYSNIIRFNDVPRTHSISRSYYYTSTGKLYVMSLATATGAGAITDKILVPTELTVPFNPANIIYLELEQNSTTVYTSDGKIYAAGNRTDATNTNTTYDLFTEYDPSWFSIFDTSSLTRATML